MNKKLTPLNDQVLLKRLKESEKVYGNIIVPDNGKEKPEIGTVIEVSKGIYNYHTDKLIPHQVQVGDLVMFPKMGPQVIEVDNEEYILCQSSQLLLLINETI